MKMLSSTDLAIALAAKNGTLRITEHASRFGEPFWALSDERGLIEVHNDECDAYERANALGFVGEPASTNRNRSLGERA